MSQPQENETCKCQDKHLDNREVLKIAIEARDFEIKMFWQRCYYFLFLNTSVGAAVATALASDRDLTAIIPFLCGIGMFVCLAWIKVGLGAKYWQQHWEGIVVDYHRELGLIDEYDIFSTINTKWRVLKSLDMPYEAEKKKATEKYIRKYTEKYTEKDTEKQAVFICKCTLCEMWNNLRSLLCLFVPYSGTYNKATVDKPSVSRWMHRTACFFFLVWVVAFFCFWRKFPVCVFC